MTLPPLSLSQLLLACSRDQMMVSLFLIARGVPQIHMRTFILYIFSGKRAGCFFFFELRNTVLTYRSAA